ncbi:MAG: peptidoglycan DD-metalloendopeptidase family protein [Sulfurovaceae bacterium]|nr:peptidoglycan DD-metalloendopeptidase family protein [Sulfurovaceae bacterium]
MKSLRLFLLVLLLLVLPLSIEAAKVNHIKWEEGLDFESYLERYGVDEVIIDTLDRDDVELISEIVDNRRYYEMIATNGTLLQALIPTGEEMQLHLFMTPKGYKLEVIPIAYKNDTYITQLPIKNSPHSDIVKTIKNRRLASEFSRVLKHSVNFKSIQRGDKLAIVYDQKMRLGQPIGMPDIKVAMMETDGKEHYVFKHTDQRYYDEEGKELIKRYMQKPLKHIRITSHFTHRRFHPVQKRWKAHLGTDFGAKRGTPILAAAKGKIIFSGWKGGYGKVIKIKHDDNYVTLYAHQSRLKAKIGQRVSQGDVIGYVGSTGRSTGPHLHFGIYKNGRAINPMRMVKFKTEGLWGSGKRAFLDRKKRYKDIITQIIESNRSSYVWNSIEERSVSPKMKSYYQSLGW